jgi:MFS family permease
MKNIKIAYALSFLWRSWFWLGIWVFNYLRYTDYAGIGLLETVMITTATLGEIPTGVIADLIGKKKTIIIAFFLGALGNIVQAIAPNYYVLMASIMIMTIGGAFYSGSLEALVYDTLKEQSLTQSFKKVIARINTMQNVGMAVAGICGGYLYQLNYAYPFYGVAIAYLIGMILSFGLIEPSVDTEKYSWKKFLLQNKEGFGQLFMNKRIAYMSLLFLVPSAFMIATENVLNDATAIELGFKSTQLGIFATLLYLFGIYASEKSEWIISKMNAKNIFILLLLIYFLTLVVMPKASFVVGAILLLLRYGASTIFGNYESVRINDAIDSRYRATTLSTFSLIKNIPYIFTATAIGTLMNIYTVKVFSMYFGILFIASLAVVYFLRPMFRR